MNSVEKNVIDCLESIKNHEILAIFTGKEVKKINGFDIMKKKLSFDRMVEEAKKIIKGLGSFDSKKGYGHLVMIRYEGSTIAVVVLQKAIKNKNLYEIAQKSCSCRMMLTPKANTETQHLTGGGTTVAENLAFQEARYRENRFSHPPTPVPTVYGIVE